MSAINKVRAKLARYPELVVEETSNWIMARPPGEDAFEVRLHVRAEDYIVFYVGWHAHLEDEDDALELFARGLSDLVRLRVTSRGGWDCAWMLQLRQGDEWVDQSIVGLLFFPFWRRKRVR